MNSDISIVQGVVEGNRRAIGKAITLIESTKPEHQKEAQDLLRKLLPHVGQTLRLGLTGVPGVGKSTFIETFGKLLTNEGLKVAVLAVDPSSQITGGSILGDKTRMEELSRDENAFIRPSPSKGTLGGITRHTRSAMTVLEAAGFDVIIVETVGVGQSEVAVADLVDMFLLLLSPGGGDELQGIKRGIMELADMVIVNKSDGDFENAAKIAANDCKNALHFMRPKHKEWVVRVLNISALQKIGLEKVWENITAFKNIMMKNGAFEAKRKSQDVAGIWAELNELLMDEIKNSEKYKFEEIELAVKNKKITASDGAQKILKAIFSAKASDNS